MTEKQQASGWLDELFQRNDSVIANVAPSVITTWGLVRSERQASAGTAVGKVLAQSRRVS